MATTHTKTAILKLSGEKVTVGFEIGSDDASVWYKNETMAEAHYLGDSDVDLLVAALVNAKVQKDERL